MIRILQQDNKAIKAIFAVIIGLAVVTMVITLVPGIFDNTNANGDTATYATVREPGFFNRIFGPSETVTQLDVTRQAQQQLQQRKLPAFLLSYVEQQAGQALIQQAILKLEGDRLGLQVTDEDLRRELHQGQLGQILFPNGKYIGDDAYMDFVQNQLQMRVPDFEVLVKKEMEQNRLEALITGGVTVSDNEVRDSYRISGTKVKFDYAVISSDDLAKTVNPSDSDLQAFFKKNAARYATAVPETRKIQYFSFGDEQLPGGKPRVTDADLQAYYAAHQEDYKVKDRVKARHILIAVKPGADAATDKAAKDKAEDILKKIKAGGDFAALAKENSDDPGSKAQGGELGFLAPGQTVPEFDKTAFSLQPGQTSGVIKTQFGYHILQVEEKETAHTKPLAEVKDDITRVLSTSKLTAAEQNFANALVAQAKKDGIEKTAAAHGLHALTTDYVGRDGVIAGVSDGTQMLAQAFTSAKNGPPASVSTGDGYAVFQVVDIKPPHAPTFDEWRSHVLSDYRDEQVPQMLAAQTAKLASTAKQMGDLRKAAAAMNLTVQTSDLVGKDGQVPDLGSMAGAASVAFSLPKGGISGPLNAGKTAGVLEVVDKQEPSADDIAKNFAETRQQMLGQAKEEVFRVYLGTLTETFEKAGSIHLKAKPAAPGIPGGPAGN
jgi:peptidyl-prolyl cis-trans isomerase D